MIKVAVLAALLGPGAAVAQAPGSGAVPKALQGHWVVAQRNYTPSDLTNPVGDLLTNLGVKLEFKQHRLSALDPGKDGTYLRVTFDAGQSPPQIDLKAPGQDAKVMRGIYRLNDDILTICVGCGNDRPTTFDDTDHNVQLVLGRARKPAANPNSP
jgi:uncharacterized protein (TIGR03067 family)